ncbi:MAG: hypothetical protein WBB23_04625 [Desulforhopalus sp.]
MKDKKNFIDDVERQIDNRNAEIAKFRIIAEVASPDDQIEFYHIIEDIVEKENEVKEKLAAFEESERDDLSDLKNEILYLQDRAEAAIEAARLKVN